MKKRVFGWILIVAGCTYLTLMGVASKLGVRPASAYAPYVIFAIGIIVVGVLLKGKGAK